MKQFFTVLLLVSGALALSGQHSFLDIFPNRPTWPNVRVAAAPNGDWLLANDLSDPIPATGKHGFYLMRYDSCGRVAWAQEASSDSVALFLADVAFLPSGDALTAGQTGGGDWFVLRLDATGQTVYLHTYEASVFDQCHAIAADEAGYALLGTHQSGGRSLNWVMRLDTAGSVQWSYTYPANGVAGANPGGGNLARASDGWWARSGNVVFRLSELGELRWAGAIPAADPLGGRWANGVALPDGGYATAFRDAGLRAFIVLSLAPDGSLRGQSAPLPGIDEPPSLALGADGRLWFGAPGPDGRPMLTRLGLNAAVEDALALNVDPDDGNSRRVTAAALPPQGMVVAGVTRADYNADFAAAFRLDGDYSCILQPTEAATTADAGPVALSPASLARRAVTAVRYDSTSLVVNPLNADADRRCEWSRDSKDWPMDTTILCTDLLEWQSPLEEAAYRWFDGATDPNRTLVAPGRYAVTAATCRTDYDIDIDLRLGFCPCAWYVPNAFSPNGDGSNDNWDVFADCPWTDFSLEVYDRWGALVFRTDQPEPGWDGAIAGRPAPEGTYLYRLQYTYSIQPALPHKNQQTGAVTLIR